MRRRAARPHLRPGAGRLLRLILAILAPGPARLFGLLHSEEVLAIPFGNIKKFGEDVILVEIDHKI